MFVRILVAGIVGAIAMFFLGFLIWGLALRGYFESTMSATAKSVMNTEPNMVPLAISQIVFGLLFAYIFDKWASISTFVGGAIGGATLMFALSLGWDLQMSAFFKDMHVGSPYVPLIVDVIAATVFGALSGGVIGQVLGMMKKD
jgi:hypothetical protein